MSNYDSFTVTKRSTAIGDLYDFILRGPQGVVHKGTNGHVCLKRAIYSATRGLTRPLRFDGMEDSSEPVHECKVRAGVPMADLHTHVHAVGIPKAGKTYGPKQEKN